jgi:hypothetical protein
MKNQELGEAIVSLLNEINEMDPSVLPALIEHRVPCNQKLADHPTVQVGKDADGYEVGILGILNGLLGTKEDSTGYLAARFKDEDLDRIERFELLL